MIKYRSKNSNVNLKNILQNINALTLFRRKIMRYKQANRVLRLAIKFSQTASMTYLENILQNMIARG